MKIEQEVLDLIIKFSREKYIEGFYRGNSNNGVTDYTPTNEDLLEEFTEFVFVENKQLF